jgi:hypothetical protein
MIAHSSKTKLLAYLLLGASVLISLTHVWYPITISSPSISERTGFPVMMTIFAACALYGYAWARITIGVLLTVFAGINLLIALAYFPTLSLNQLAQIVPISLILGVTGILFLYWKGIRVFEKQVNINGPITIKSTLL